MKIKHDVEKDEICSAAKRAKVLKAVVQLGDVGFRTSAWCQTVASKDEERHVSSNGIQGRCLGLVL